MRMIRKILLLFIATGFLYSCFSDFDDDGNSNVKDFVWKGLNAFYLYKDFKPDLADDRFASNDEYNEYLDLFSSPKELFDNLLYEPNTIDEFSFLTSDYISLEQQLSGTTVSNGMEFGLREVPGSSNELYGYVRYVLPNTSAETQGVQRGDIFHSINGATLTYSNYTDLYFTSSYTIGLGTYDNNGTPGFTDDDSVIPGTESVTLSKSSYTENPVYKTEILNIDGNNVGYLMYNAFTADFDTQLNNAFGTFLSANITDLVLDLRYNSGGSVFSAVTLGSMITGQYTDEVFSMEQWNSEWQEYFETNEPEALLNRFTDETRTGAAINSLNLTKLYVLTTGNSASASELVINSLIPYLGEANLIQIGTNTTGKFQASTTLYDSPDFNRAGANPNHTYAMLPLIYKSLNIDGTTDYFDGLTPTIELAEDIGNLGVLGAENEPLLAEAIAHIQGSSRIGARSFQKPKEIGDSKTFSLIKNRMFSEKKLPVKY